MKNLRMNAKAFVGYKKGEDYDPKSVRPGPKGGTAPEFKCFNCGKWFDGNNWRYSLSPGWYPGAPLKHKINFLCGASCSTEITPRYEKYYKYELPEGA